MLRRLALALALSTSGCSAAVGGAARPATTTPAEFPGAHFLARSMMDGRVEALLHFDRLPLYSAKRYLAELYGWTRPLEQLGLDPVSDVQRVYVTARHATTSSKLLVVQHRGDPDEVRRRLGDGARARKPRAPHRPVVVGGEPYLMVAAQAQLLVFAPRRFAGRLDGFAHVGGLPAPTDGEAAVYAADRPSESVNSGPTWPLGFERAFATLVFDAAAGAHVRFDGTTRANFSTDVNAEQLQEMMNGAMTFRVPVIGKVTLFDPPRARVSGDHVLAGAYFTSDEFEWIVGVGTWMLDVDLGRKQRDEETAEAHRNRTCPG